MLRKILLSVVAILALAVVPVAAVGATGDEHREMDGFRLRGMGACQADGSFKIVWSVKNREDERLKITVSSNESVVPKGTRVPGNETKHFEQIADGTQPAKYTLVLRATWVEWDDGEKEKEHQWRKDSVRLTEACPQPTAAKTTLTPGVVLPAQVTAAPSGGVSAGGGGAVVTSLGAVAGLTGSLASVGLGLRRLNRL